MKMDYPPYWNFKISYGGMILPVKYALLIIAVVFLLGTLSILAWQACRYCVHTHTPQGIGDYSASEDKNPEQQCREVDTNRFSLSSTTLSASEYCQLNGDMKEELVKVGGLLRFSVHYDHIQSHVVVTILQLERLQQHCHSSDFQVFVRLLLLWDKSQGAEMEVYQDIKDQQKECFMWTVIQEWRSCIVRGSSCPVFGDQFSSVLQEHIRPHLITLKMEVRHIDTFSKHKALGEVRVPFNELNISTPVELQRELQVPQKDLVGELLLSLNFLPTLQRLEIGLLKVKVATINTSSITALCARISVMCNQYRQKSQKSSVVAHSFVTVFNEAFYFPLSEVPVVQCKISVSIFQKEIMKRKSPKRLIGQVILGKDKTFEDKHWTHMMRSVRHPVTLWHAIVI
ncbi:synaptotagmin-2 [Boleophthalmus pectinirostris]|uniref:synaptotagmin-2 n=1 Tax=Boleophthalmus pectinirostris TaxID=150288 RepID=UPI000A1C2AFB|nr:synaptotagmin-2 [Boleophthalmus pectinirostris]